MGKKRIIIVCCIVVFFILGIVLSFLYNKNKYSVYFETGTNDILLTKYVSKGDKISEPKPPVRDGYIFKEWQLNGKKYDFSTEIEGDTVLTAKWIKEEYITISYIDDEEIIQSIEILKGDKIDTLPIVSKENYNFIGWYLDGKVYNNQELYDDTTLVAKYEIIKEEPKLKLGDRVDIIGNYASSSYSTSAQYSAAIGWDREILDIIDDSEFPYMVGDSTGVTGFFKEDSLNLRG